MDVAPSPPADSVPAVDMRRITKRFGRLAANDAIDFDVKHGEIHALLGENGAGKTTLMHILSGFFRADEGEIFFDGKEARIRSPIDAFSHGVGMVHQQSALVPTLTVVENVLLGSEGFRLPGREVDAVAAELRAIGARYGLDVTPEAYVWQLSVGEQQRVEILRALYRQAKVLILDEPTASLTPTEVEPLLEKLRGIARHGATIVLITHHLDEVMVCADRITVLRMGKKIDTTTPSETNTRELARLMVGRDIELMAVLTGAEAQPAQRGVSERGATLVVSNLSVIGSRGLTALHDESFDVRPGEITAVVGVEGNGQAELEEVLFGLRPPASGRVEVDGQDVTGRTPAELLSRRVGLIPSDRYRRGLIRSLSIADNLVIDRIDRAPFGDRFRIHPRAILASARASIDRFGIGAASPRQRAGTLSGGNGQRVVLARALSDELSVLIAAQPTRGLDVGAIDFVRDQLREQRGSGVAVLLLSTDLDEIFALADRCFVIYRGRLVGPWLRRDFDREEFGLAMGGAVVGARRSP